MSAAGFQLKGNGWYATDFKNKGKSPEKTKNSEKSESAKEDKKESPSKDSAASPAGGTAPRSCRPSPAAWTKAVGS